MIHDIPCLPMFISLKNECTTQVAKSLTFVAQDFARNQKLRSDSPVNMCRAKNRNSVVLESDHGM